MSGTPERASGSRRVWERAVLVAGDGAALAGSARLFHLPARSTLLLVVPALTVLSLGGHQRLSVGSSLTPGVARVAGAVLLVVAVGAGLPAPAERTMPLVRAGLLAAVFVVVIRSLSYAGFRRQRARGAGELTVVIGAGRVGMRVAELMLEHPECGLRPVGFLEDGPGVPDLPAPLLGATDRLEGIVREHEITRVVVAFGATTDHDLVSILRDCTAAGVEIYVVPRLFELAAGSQTSDAERMWDVPLIRLRRSAIRPAAARVKRVVDVAVAGVALVVSAPLLAVLAVAVRVSSRGPAFFRQTRLGQGQRPFEVLKLRTMRLNNDGDTAWAIEGDARITPLGRVLRATSLDELPQLFNVLRGDMSLVGPRPERPFFARRFADEFERYEDRHRMPTGMTGLAQVHGLRGDSSIEERAGFDNQYIESWSVWLDLRIMVRTAGQVVRDVLVMVPARAAQFAGRLVRRRRPVGPVIDLPELERAVEQEAAVVPRALAVPETVAGA